MCRVRSRVLLPTQIRAGFANLSERGCVRSTSRSKVEASKRRVQFNVLCSTFAAAAGFANTAAVLWLGSAAQEDGTARWNDPELLDRAAELGRVLFSQDEDLLIEAAKRQRTGVPFQGVIYVPQLALSIGQCIEKPEILAKAGTPEDFVNRVQYFPLR